MIQILWNCKRNPYVQYLPKVLKGFLYYSYEFYTQISEVAIWSLQL